MKVDVIITDHHEMPTLLPSAFAIINPHQLGQSHPLSYLAGVGVAYNFMRAYGQKYSPELVVNQYLDLVALGTVADIAVLKDENRFYVQRGLTLMNQGLRPSLKTIMTSARVRYKIITENTLGFVFGPRLNSAGRLDDANENIEFLISDDQQLLEVVSTKLERLNERRKYLSENLFQSAIALIERERDQRNRSVLIMHRAGWEPGVLGIVAGKLAEKYSKPCILLNDEGDISSGSARSVNSINITHLLDENNEYLISHGGHSMAAGLTLHTTNLDKFIEKINRSLEEKGYKYPPEQALQIDHIISLPDLSSDLLKEIRLLAPFGNGNAPPLFALRGTVVQDIRRFGANNEHASWVFTSADGKQTEMTYWNFGEGEVPEEPLDIAFYIQPDEYRGNGNFKLEHVASRPHEPDSKSTVSVIPKLDIIDLRDQNDPLRALATILESHAKSQIFYEGLQKPGNLEVVNRFQIQKSDTLVLLNPPPSLDVLIKSA